MYRRVALALMIAAAATSTHASSSGKAATPPAPKVVVPVWYPDPFWWDWPVPAWGTGPFYVPLEGYGSGVEMGSAVVQTDVHPRGALVLVDGQEMGTARHFNGGRHSLWLQPGEHVVQLQADGYKTLRLQLDTKEGRYYRLQYDLVQGNGPDPRSEETGPRPS